MRRTLLDAYNALTWRHCLAGCASLAVFLLTVWLFGFNVAKRFVFPAFIILSGLLAHLSARKIRESQDDPFSKMAHAGSAGAIAFGVIAIISACVDAVWFPIEGYLTFTVITMLAMWITYHFARAYIKLRQMTPEELQHVTQGTALIVATMRQEINANESTLQEFAEVKQELRLVG